MNSPFAIIIPGYPMITDFQQVDNTKYIEVVIFQIDLLQDFPVLLVYQKSALVSLLQLICQRVDVLH